MSHQVKLARISVNRAVEQLISEHDLRRTTVVQHPTMTVVATRQRRYRSRSGGETILVTYGRPNHRNRKFIKACQKAGEPFPVRKVQLEYWPKRRK